MGAMRVSANWLAHGKANISATSTSSGNVCCKGLACHKNNRAFPRKPFWPQCHIFHLLNENLPNTVKQMKLNSHMHCTAYHICQLQHPVALCSFCINWTCTIRTLLIGVIRIHGSSLVHVVCCDTGCFVLRKFIATRNAFIHACPSYMPGHINSNSLMHRTATRHAFQISL